MILHIHISVHVHIDIVVVIVIVIVVVIVDDDVEIDREDGVDKGDEEGKESKDASLLAVQGVRLHAALELHLHLHLLLRRKYSVVLHVGGHRPQ